MSNNTDTGEVNRVCMCKPGHHVEPNKNYKYTGLAPWERDGVFFCAHGWTDSKSVWDTESCSNIDLAQAVADYYLLDGIKHDVIVPRPFVKPSANVSFEVRLHHDTKWRECCDTTEDDMHKPWCKPSGRKPSTTQAGTTTAPFGEHTVRNIMEAMRETESIPSTMPVIRTRAWLRHESHIATLAWVFRNYAHYAIAGEMDDHRGNECNDTFDRHDGHRGYRAGWFKFVQHVGGEKAASWAAELFLDGNWNGSYGGKPWADIATTLANFERTGEAWLFVDRMFSLQHNCGTVFDKVTGWKSVSGTTMYGLKEHDGPLDSHANSKFDRLGGYASEYVRALLTDYWTLANNEQTARGIEVTPMPEFTLTPKAAPVTAYEPNSGCDCDLCHPEWWCTGCGNKLTGKEKNHVNYGGKCEKCAKTNKCTGCSKAIVTTKDQCDHCKANGVQAKTDPAWPSKYEPVEAPAVTGYSLTPPAPKFTPPAPSNYVVQVVDDNDDDWEDDDTDGDVW